MFDTHEVEELLTVAGVDIPPVGAPGPNAQTIAHKIAWDGFTQKLAWELAAEAFTVAAVKSMTQSQRAVLRKRLDLGGAAPAPSVKVSWHVAIPVMPSTPVALIGRLYGERDAEGKIQTLEEVRYCGSVEGAHRVTWKGTRPPAEVVEEYQRAYKPVVDATYHLAANANMKPNPPVIGLPEDFAR